MIPALVLVAVMAHGSGFTLRTTSTLDECAARGGRVLKSLGLCREEFDFADGDGHRRSRRPWYTALRGYDCYGTDCCCNQSGLQLVTVPAQMKEFVPSWPSDPCTLPVVLAALREADRAFEERPLDFACERRAATEHIRKVLEECEKP